MPGDVDPSQLPRDVAPLEVGTKRSIEMTQGSDPATRPVEHAPASSAGVDRRPRARAASNRAKAAAQHSSSLAHEQPMPKVAIPRLSRGGDVASAAGAGDKNRVSHACEPCRSRKTKCTGARPECEHCKEYRLHCYYADGKRDRAKKEMGSLQERVDEYEQLLRHLSIRGDSATQLAIQKALKKSTTPEGDERPARASSGARAGHRALAREGPVEIDAEVSDDGEDRVGGEVGSTGSLDHVNQDFGRDDAAASAGYFGKTSDVAWIERARREAIEPSGAQGQEPLDPDYDNRAAASPGAAASAPADDARPPTYYLDDDELHLPEQVDETALPPRTVADVLVGAYFGSMQLSFPILSRDEFNDVYERCFGGPGEPVSRRWRAAVNLVFAIGAKYCFVTRSGWCEQRDHLVYFSRARLLSLDNGALWAVGDLGQVQVMGLAALYLMASHHVNRAWYVCGLAIRYGQALGLHLRNTSQRAHMPNVRKERDQQVWWSLYSLESLLVGMTGRPSGINDRDVSTAIPAPVDDEARPCGGGGSGGYDALQPSSLPANSSGGEPASSASSSLATPTFATPAPLSTGKHATTEWMVSAAEAPSSLPKADATAYFAQRIKLNVLLHQISSELYNVEAVHRSWSASQRFIEACSAKLDRWLDELPRTLSFRHRQLNGPLARERMTLGMLFWSTRIVLARPWLCKLEGQIPDESATSKLLNRRTAAACVHAASEMLRLLPDEPDAAALYAAGPWWSVLHHLSQAASVIMLELAFTASHVPHEAQQIFVEARKAVAWLRAMAEESVAADRAWHLLDRLLRHVAPRVGGDTSDMPRVSSRRGDAGAASAASLGVLDGVTTSLPSVDAAWSWAGSSDAAARAQAEAFSWWQQDQQQQAFFHDFGAALGGPSALPTALGEQYAPTAPLASANAFGFPGGSTGLAQPAPLFDQAPVDGEPADPRDARDAAGGNSGHY